LGEWKNGLFDGEAKSFLEDGNYAGQYVAGVRHGYGIFIGLDGTYTGEWHHGKMEGQVKWNIRMVIFMRVCGKKDNIMGMGYYLLQMVHMMGYGQMDIFMEKVTFMAGIMVSLRGSLVMGSVYMVRKFFQTELYIRDSGEVESGMEMRHG